MADLVIKLGLIICLYELKSDTEHAEKNNCIYLEEFVHLFGLVSVESVHEL